MASRHARTSPNLFSAPPTLADDWLRGANEDTILVGYAQSWALFRMLMDERPDALRKYLTTIYPRR